MQCSCCGSEFNPDDVIGLPAHIAVCSDCLDVNPTLSQAFSFNSRQLSTVLAALRLYQAELTSGRGIPDRFKRIADDGESLAPLSADEIDDLCGEINQ